MSSQGGSIVKVIFLLLLLAVVVVGGLLWFDHLGILDAREPLDMVLGLFGIEPEEELAEPMDSPWLLDEERLKKRQQAVDLQLEEIRMAQEDQQVKKNELLQWSEELSEREKAVSEKENSLNEALKMYDNKEANLEQMAIYWGGMLPDNAVAIMNSMDSLDVVDVLRTSERLAREAGEPSLVAFWISKMEPDRAAEIQRLMTRDAEE
ncbi:MAG: flagellar protein FlbB [Spirochaetales bacterium]|nr:flagellar protein FlbB [Spirochaetales bacterium]